MNDTFVRMKRNGEAACTAVRFIPKLLSSGRIGPAEQRQLSEAIERNRQEIGLIAIEMSDIDPRAFALAGKIAGIWSTLHTMVDKHDCRMGDSPLRP